MTHEKGMGDFLQARDVLSHGHVHEIFSRENSKICIMNTYELTPTVFFFGKYRQIDTDKQTDRQTAF